MKVLAKAIKGKEFFYSVKSAHKVNPKNARLIRDALNMNKYMLKDGEIWHLYDIDKYDMNAYAWAENQRFYVTKNGTIKEQYLA